jgi:hypothetical protein
MPTRAQIDANIRNAKLSSGPKTEEGKAIAAKNNTSHGLAGAFTVMPWESQLDFDALRDALRNEHQPATPTEQLLVDGMAQYHWLRDRAMTLQQGCFDLETGKISDQKSFALYLRYETTHQRAFHKSLNDLLKLRAEKRKAEIGFESQRRQNEAHIRQHEKHAMKKQHHKVAMLELKRDAEYTNRFGGMTPEQLAAKYGFEMEA